MLCLTDVFLKSVTQAFFFRVKEYRSFTGDFEIKEFFLWGFSCILLSVVPYINQWTNPKLLAIQMKATEYYFLLMLFDC